MSQYAVKGEPIAFTPGLTTSDPLAEYWMRQAMLRLRREVCWLWHERSGGPAPSPELLPPPGDRLMASLDMARYRDAKRAFFEEDVTGAYLSKQLMEPPPRVTREAARGSFSAVVKALELDDVSAFVLALGLLDCVDNAVGPVLAACLNDPAKVHPTLALVQRLWDRPEEVLAVGDPMHPLWRYGLLLAGTYGTGQPSAFLDWETPFSVAPVVASQLLYPERPAPHALAAVDALDEDEGSNPTYEVAAARLRTASDDRLCIVPVRGTGRDARMEAASAVASAVGMELRQLVVDTGPLEHPAHLRAMLAVAWLRNTAVFLEEAGGGGHAGEHPRLPTLLAGMRTIPAVVFMAVTGREDLVGLPGDLLMPAVEVPEPSYGERLEAWRRYLGEDAKRLEGAIAECARRFRYDRSTIRSICVGLRARQGELTEAELLAACRAEAPLDPGGLAQEVTPRFREEELVLPPDQMRQFQEIYRAMRSLTQVHYGWGTGRAWNESGISVLFAGPPGTGKTMAAEVLAAKLDMPMYRIDLSQVVNKYIGETEKNLKRLFDFADVSDTILFFDEADSLFGKRTEVRDAHDRYANLEVSYLLERMERFKGLAILATNRRKDLDDAFARRLRYIVEFPLPDEEHRRLLWRQMLPASVDASDIDVPFLARQFPLSGGHIRSIILNACLQAAFETGNSERPVLRMEQVIVAVKREYDKLGRSIGLEQFGPFSALVEGMERG